MGIGIFAVWPLAKKFGKRNVTMIGFILYAVGSLICWIFQTNLVMVLIGQFIKNIGGLPCAYVFMALFADCLDHLEWKTDLRIDGAAMSIYNIIAVAMVGIMTGVFNWMLSKAGYLAPFTAKTVSEAASTLAANGWAPQIALDSIKPAADGVLTVAMQQPSSHNVTPSASNNDPVREHERFHPVITTSPNGKKLLDFGQNIAGYAAFRVNARVGQRMIWRFGEMIDNEGNLTQKNIQLSRKGFTTPLQRIDYTCGEGLNEYKTRFAVFGFRYAEVETDLELDPKETEAIAVYSDLERTGWFSCSNELLNRFVDATVWSAKGNHLDIPTDCPTRERHGWTGDAQLFFTTASYLFDFAPFAKKYLHDVFDWQKKNGRLPHIAPDGGADFYMWTMNGSVGWSDVGVLMPHRYSEINRDDSVLNEFYDGMAKYARFMETRCGKTMPFFGKHVKLPNEAKPYFVNRGQSYGEWAEPADVDGGFRWQDFVAPHPEVSTAYTCHVLGLMANVAEKLGHKKDAEEFRTYSDGCRAAYRELVKTDEYTLDTDRQARLVRPLYFGLLDDKQTEFAKKRLIKALENYGWRLGTGFLSTPLILYVLSSYNIEAAYRLLENEELPGWLSMPKNGATTIWEAWEGPNSTQGGIGSLNHYSKGAMVEWLFKTMCGINVTGNNHFTVAPQPGGHFTHAEASYNSIFGLVESRWERKNGKTVYTITIPANCTAELVIPERRPETVSAGSYIIEA